MAVTRSYTESGYSVIDLLNGDRFVSVTAQKNQLCGTIYANDSGNLNKNV